MKNKCKIYHIKKPTTANYWFYNYRTEKTNHFSFKNNKLNICLYKMQRFPVSENVIRVSFIPWSSRPSRSFNKRKKIRWVILYNKFSIASKNIENSKHCPQIPYSNWQKHKTIFYKHYFIKIFMHIGQNECMDAERRNIYIYIYIYIALTQISFVFKVVCIFLLNIKSSYFHIISHLNILIFLISFTKWKKYVAT